MEPITRTTRAFSVHTAAAELLRVSASLILRLRWVVVQLGIKLAFSWNIPTNKFHAKMRILEYSSYLILDTNVILQQMDLLELNIPPLSRIIVLETVFDELKNLNSTIFSHV